MLANNDMPTNTLKSFYSDLHFFTNLASNKMCIKLLNVQMYSLSYNSLNLVSFSPCFGYDLIILSLVLTKYFQIRV